MKILINLLFVKIMNKIIIEILQWKFLQKLTTYFLAFNCYTHITNMKSIISRWYLEKDWCKNTNKIIKILWKFLQKWTTWFFSHQLLYAWQTRNPSFLELWTFCQIANKSIKIRWKFLKNELYNFICNKLLSAQQTRKSIIISICL